MSDAAPAEFMDAITMEIMTDPVITCDGQTYERRSIEEWLRSKNTSPITGAVLASKNLTQNIALKNLIDDFKVRRAQKCNSRFTYSSSLVKVSEIDKAETTPLFQKFPSSPPPSLR